MVETGTNKLERFFEYNTKLGRQIIGSKSMGFAQTRLSDDLLKSFWRRIWVFNMLEKIKLWLWLLSDKAAPMGSG